MQVSLRLLVLMVVGIAALLSGCKSYEHTSQRAFKLTDIPAQMPERYARIQDAEHWENPFLTITSDGIRVRCKPAAFDQKISIADLHRTLLSFPASAWPYGRVVAVEVGSGPITPGTEPFIEESRLQVEAILRTAGIAIDYWPGA